MAQRDPYFGYNFRVEIDGIQRAGFMECSGLDAHRSAISYREGTDRQLNQRKVPGTVQYADVTLSRGVTDNKELADWATQVRSGVTERKNMSIVLMNDQREDVVRWDLRECWPTDWSGPSLDATSSSMAIESMTITHEGFEISQWQ